jgi:Glutamine synthetase, catalytic domain
LRRLLVGETIAIEAQHHEVATGGQNEIDMRFATLTRMADNLMIYKYVVKNTARQHGMTATFKPKPLFEDNASGMHVHQSLWKDETNLFYDKADYAELSELGRYYIGGLLTHAWALCGLCAPTTNSYRRLVPGYEAPINLVYSQLSVSTCSMPSSSSGSSEEVSSGSTSETRDRILAGLKPHLTGATRAATVAACRGLAVADGETLCSARVFAFIGSRLDPPERSALVGRALTIARALSFDWPAARKASLRDWKRTFDERPGRAHVLADILSLIPLEERGAIMDEALAAARAIGTSHLDERAEAFTRLAHLVSEDERAPIVAEAIAAAHGIYDEYDKEDALVRLAPVLSLSHGSEAIAAAVTIDSIYLRARALEALAPRLSKQDVVVGLMECLAGARTLDDGEFRNRAVNALSRFIPGMDRSTSNGEQNLDEWSRSANADKKPLSETHLAVVTSLADQVLAEASSGELDGDDQRLGALISTIPKLPERIYQIVVNALLEATRNFKNEAAKRGILTQIAGQLRDVFAVEAMKIALTIVAPDDRAETLAALVPRLPDRESSSAFAVILELSPRIQRGLLLLALAKSAAAIHRIGGVNAVRETVDAIRDVGRWWP